MKRAASFTVSRSLGRVRPYVGFRERETINEANVSLYRAVYAFKGGSSSQDVYFSRFFQSIYLHEPIEIVHREGRREKPGDFSGVCLRTDRWLDTILSS